MRRLLIAVTGELAKGIAKQLKTQYDVAFCDDGEHLTQKICGFDPDILLLDMSLAGTDCFAVIESMIAAGRQTAVVVILNYNSDYILARLERLGVKFVLTKPCQVSFAVSHIRQIDFLQQNADMSGWSLENEIEKILLDLGFGVGKRGYYAIYRAIAYKYAHRECQMKQVYYAVADAQGTSFTQVEKGVRDAIGDAYNNGDPCLWRLYFKPRRKAKMPYPTGEEFVARIVECLYHRTRLKAPYMDKAE